MAAVSDDGELRTAWLAHVGSGPAADAAYDEVVGRYRESQRRYHGVRHLTHVVRHVTELATATPVTDEGAVVAAAFYHDAVYDPRARDNEVQSAELGQRVLRDLGWSAERRHEVARLVLLTAGHTPAGDDPAGAVLVDADLAILGAEPEVYGAYVLGVRAEYAHVPAAGWRTGRAAVLSDFAARARIYSTDAGRDRWEARARANVAAELATLRQ